MNMKKWKEELMKAKTKKPMPLLSFPCVQLLGVSVKELISSGEKQAMGMKLIADKFAPLASVSMMDLSVEAEAFGATVHFAEDEVPAIASRTVTSYEDAKNLIVPPVMTSGRCAEYIKAVEIAKKEIVDRPVFAGVIGPYSLAGRLMDVSEIMIACFDEPETVELVLDKTTEFLINYIKEYKAVGADGIVMAEPLTGMLSPSLAEEFSAPFVKRIVDAVQDDNFMVIYHNCGNNVLKMTDALLSSGAECYHLGNAISLKEALEVFPSDRLVMGNVNPVLLKSGSKEEIEAETKKIMEECSSYPNFVVSSGCDIPHDSPIENIETFFKSVKEFYGE